MVSYKKENVNIDVQYSVEYIDNAHDWEYVCGGSYANGEPWEYYKSRKFNSLDEALSLYLVLFFRMCNTTESGWNGIYDVKLFEEAVLDGEVLRESYIEPESTILYNLHTTFGHEQATELYRLRKQKEEQTALLDRYAAFVKKFGAEEMFKKFVQEENDQGGF